MRTLEPRQLSRELRTHVSKDLTRRRWMLGLQLVGIAAGAAVALFQMGVLKRLPDLPSKRFDATRVDASDYGYEFLQVPDALLMIGQYAVSAILVGMGGEKRARDLPVVPLALTAKLLGDVATNLYLAKEEWRYNHALCGYCQSATVASAISLALSLPEARRAYAQLQAG